jgi:hypothetical protein
LEGENAIIIPIHYQDNHWINVTRREQIPGEVTFFYADNLNCPHTSLATVRDFLVALGHRVRQSGPATLSIGNTSVQVV